MTTQNAQFFGKLWVLRDRKPTLTGGNNLHRMKAEDGDIAKTAVTNLLILIFTPNGVRGVLDDPEPVLLAQCMDTSHVAGLAA